MKKVLQIILMGYIFLVIAIIINFIAFNLSISTWYDFFSFQVDLTFIDYLYLFIIYPTLLGSLIYFLNDFFKNK
jgi:hypothetical protein